MERKSQNRKKCHPGRQRHLAPTVYRPELARDATASPQSEAPLEGDAPRRAAFRRSARADVHSHTRSDHSAALAWSVAV